MDRLILHTSLIVPQCLQSVFSTHHARLSDEVIEPSGSRYYSAKIDHLHECAEVSVQGLAGGKDGPHAVRIYSW